MPDPLPSHRWSPLADLSATDLAAASDELRALAAVWAEQRGQLGEQQVAEFNERLEREWAIETGVIERVYSLDRGTTQLLIERGIDASLIGHDETDQPPEFVAGVISDQKAAVVWLFTVVKQERPLSTSFIKELHALMTGRQTHTEGRDQFGAATRAALLHGEYKRWPNNPSRPDGSVHEYCPPEQVAAEMDRLVEIHLKHMAAGVAPEVEAAWLHHRFTQIHPFQDGNGRVARALASLVLIRAGLFPLVVTRDDRVRYIDALEEDRGELRPLVDLVVAIEKKSLVSALSIAEELRRGSSRVDEVIEAIGDMFADRREARPELDQAPATTRELWSVTNARFASVKDELASRIANGTSARHVVADSGDDTDPERRVWHRLQVVETAASLGYFANMRDFHEWCRLVFVTENGRAEILLSFHAVGHQFRGLIGASACFYRRQDEDDAERQIIELRPIVDELFQVNYKEDPASVQRRFVVWLEAALVHGLDHWRRSE